MATLDLVLDEEMARDIREYMIEYSEPEWRTFSLRYEKLTVLFVLGYPIATGAFKLKLKGYDGGDDVFQFIGYLPYADDLRMIQAEIVNLTEAYLATRVVDSQSEEVLCRAMRHGLEAERAYRLRYSQYPVREELYLFTSKWCSYCYETNQLSTADFASLIPDSDTMRRW